MRSSLKGASVAAIAAAIFGGTAYAAPEDEKHVQALELVRSSADAQERQDRRVVEAQGPADRPGYSPPDPTFQLRAGSDEKEVSVGLTVGRSIIRVDPKDKYRQRSESLRFSAIGFAPVDKDAAKRFVSLADPVSGARLKVGLTYYFSNYSIRQADVDAAVAVMNASFGKCVRERVHGWSAFKPEDGRRVAADYLNVVATLEAAGRETEQALATVESPAFADLGADAAVAEYRDVPEFKALSAARGGGAFKEIQAVVDTCRVGTADGFKANELLIRQYGESTQIRTSIRAVTANAPTFFVGGNATFGRKSYSYIDRAAFALQDKPKGEYALAAFAGVISGDGLWSLRAAVTHSLSYDAQDQIELCQPTATAGQTQCLTGAGGPPARSKVTALSVEGRRLFTIPGTKSQIGVAPEFAINPSNGKYSIDVPVYLAPDKDGNLTGGVQVSYGSKKKNVVFGVFVGVPFTVFQ